MENASKALLIAGAILIVILLIAVGMLVYSQSRGVIDTGVAQMSSAEIQMFNAQFTGYEGVQNKTAMKNLIQTVINNNTKYKEDESRWVYSWMITESVGSNGNKGYSGTGASIKSKHTTYKSLIKDLQDIINYIDNSKGNKKFHVYIEYGETGLVNNIKIIQVGAENFANAASKTKN